MSKWWTENFTLANIIQILILLGGIVWLVAFVRSDIDRNTEWNERQDTEHSEFMRRDVGAAQFNAIKNQLDRIESKLEDE